MIKLTTTSSAGDNNSKYFIKIFPEKIFQKFSEEKKIKTLFDILYKIESSWNDLVKKRSLIFQFYRYFGYCQISDFNEIIFISHRKFLYSLAKVENRYNIFKSDPQMNLIFPNTKVSQTKKRPPIVAIIDNLRSAFNVGSIFRTAECLGVESLYLCGSTPTPENRKVQQTSMGTSQRVNWRYFSDTKDALFFARDLGYTIYAVETSNSSKNIGKNIFIKKSALIFGNEALGIDESVLSKADKIIKIPLSGWKNSLNVGVCFGICLYVVNQNLIENNR